MYKKEFNTHFVGQTRSDLPSCPSTNDYLKELLKNDKLTNGQLVNTPNQTAGRGQLSNKWESEKFKNLTFSVGLIELDFPVINQFQLNIISSLAVVKTLIDCFNIKASIKWPNDILIDDKKVAGILIETTLKNLTINSAIIGIGLNVNQSNFKTPHATSILNKTGQPVELESLLETMCKNLEHFIFRKEDLTGLKKKYLNHLYQYQTIGNYLDGEGQFKGIISDVNESGELIIMKDAYSVKYQPKQIKFLL